MRALLALVAAVLVAGCASSTGPAGHGATAASVTERDFRIEAPRHIRAGDVRLAVRNRGPVAHELVVVKLSDSPLPLRRDGMTVDEDAVEARTAFALEPQPAGTVSRLRIRLTRGRYELLCNMAGHYRGGMHTELDVG
jgi:uncharacterized cupredoxin-like copper-binding protein